jgi:hypothetical protein
LPQALEPSQLTSQAKPVGQAIVLVPQAPVPLQSIRQMRLSPSHPPVHSPGQRE